MDVSSHGAEQVDFTLLFTQQAAFVWRVLRRFGVAESDLPDACQDVFIVVHRKVSDFEGRSNLRTWIYRICARVASDYRKRAHRRYETEALTREPSVGGDQLRAIELSEICVLVENALDGLDDEKRQVFVLYELEDMAMTDVALLMDCPLKTAFSRLYVARERVNAALRRAGCAGLIVGLDPLPLRETAHEQLVSALRATGGAEPTAAQLNLLSSTSAATSALAAPALFSGAALAVAAAFVLSLANAHPNVSRVPKPQPQLQQVHASAATAQVEPSVTEAKPIPIDLPLAATSVALVAPSTSSSAASVQRKPKRAPSVARVPNVIATADPARVEALPSEWIEAPSSVQANPVATTSTPSTGLDEVLSATSIRSLMRVGPWPSGESSREH